MAQTIKLKRSATQSAVPTTSQLELGEVAINTYDGKMYIKKDDGTESIVEVGQFATFVPSGNDGELQFNNGGVVGAASFTFIDDVNNRFGLGTDTPSTTLEVVGTVTATAFDGSLDWSNVANKPDPTLTLNGDVSGSATFTDLGDATLTVTIADDSHNHIISNVDGLQTALNAKQDASTALTTTTSFGGDVSGTYNAIVVANDSHTHDGRYYTETESDARFVNVTGDTMTGNLDVTGTVTADGLTVESNNNATGAVATLSNTNISTDSNTVLGNLVFKSNDASAGATNAEIKSLSAGTNGQAELYLRTGSSGTIYDRLKVSYIGDISFYEDTGTTPKFFWDASAESLAITGADNTWTITNTTLYGNRAGQVYIGANNAAGQLALISGSSEAMRITSAGNVGIGTSSPTQVLDIVSGSDTLAAIRSSGTGEVALRLQNSATGTGANGLYLGRTGAGANYLWTYETEPIIFGTSNGEKMRLDSSGNLLVAGTSSLTTSTGIEPVFQIIGQSAATGSMYITRDENSVSPAAIYGYKSRNSGATVQDNDSLFAINADGSDGANPIRAGSIRFEVDGTPATNNIPTAIVFDRSDGAAGLTESMRIDSSGNVGIGTTTPSTNLSVSTSSAHGIELGQDTSNPANSARLFFSTSAGSTAIIAQSGATVFFTGATVGSNTGTERMRIDSSGNLGIGTSSPAALLNVYTDAGRDFRVDHGTANRTILSTDRGMIVKAGAGYSLDLDTGSANGTIRFLDNGTAHSAFDASGNLGIGTTAPSRKLEVNFTTSTVGARFTRSDAAGSSTIEFANTAGVKSSIGFNAGSNNFDIYHNGSTRVVVDSSGNVGIGTTSPSGQLHVSNTLGDCNNYFQSSTTGLSQLIFSDGSVAGKIAYRHPTDALEFTVNGSERMRIDSSGDLLVGKTSDDFGTTQGVELRPTGNSYFTSDGGNALRLNRLTSDGDILTFRKDGTTVGTIGTESGNLYIDGSAATGKTGIEFSGSEWFPRDTGANSDGVVSLGDASNRFKDFHLSGSVILGASDVTLTSNTATLATTTQTEIASFSATSYGGGKFVITAKDGSNRHIVELLVTHDGTTAVATQYGSIFTSAELATYDVDISGGNVRILATSASTNSTVYKVAETLMEA